MAISKLETLPVAIQAKLGAQFNGAEPGELLVKAYQQAFQYDRVQLAVQLASSRAQVDQKPFNVDRFFNAIVDDMTEQLFGMLEIPKRCRKSANFYISRNFERFVKPMLYPLVTHVQFTEELKTGDALSDTQVINLLMLWKEVYCDEICIKGYLEQCFDDSINDLLPRDVEVQSEVRNLTPQMAQLTLERNKLIAQLSGQQPDATVDESVCGTAVMKK